MKQKIPPQRVDEILEPLVEGRWYLVPTVKGEWLNTHGVAYWPVIGPRHKDIDLGVTVSHYHIDHRFVPIAEFRCDTNTVVNESNDAPVRYRRWKCLQSAVMLNNVTTSEGYAAFKRKHAGEKCEGHKRTGWRCPHRGVWLGGQPACGGVIICPAHGLKIDAKTGRVLPP